MRHGLSPGKLPPCRRGGGLAKDALGIALLDGTGLDGAEVSIFVTTNRFIGIGARDCALVITKGVHAGEQVASGGKRCGHARRRNFVFGPV